MIKIKVYNNFLPEKEYILSVLFGEFLGIEFKVETHKKKMYEIILENKKTVLIKDAFFSEIKNNNYLLKENLPQKIFYSKNKFLSEKDIPVIYGDAELKAGAGKIECGIDIFASSFFMLTRWEEYVDKTRDSHDRFPAKASAAFKNNFLERPVVNEYTEMLWKMMKALDKNIQRKKRVFKIIPTHDVDHPLFSTRGVIKAFCADLFKRKDFKTGINSVINVIKGRLDKKKDLFNTFDFLMKISENNGLKSHFFFLANKREGANTGYSLKNSFIKKLLIEIDKRGHVIGFHPGRSTYTNKKKWEKELDYLRKNSPQKINCGRHHFLKFSAPATWNIWYENNIEWDSTLGYPEAAGFRCGSCYEYSVFDFIKRKKLKLKEKPLTVMEISLNYGKEDSNFDLDKIKSLRDKVKKYNGEFVLLWHNSSFNLGKWKNAENIYKEIFKQ